MIPYGKQDINQADIDAVVSVLKSDFLTQGPQVPAFEKALANICQAKFAVATSNATSSLHIANLALGVGQGDIVWTSPITFVATSNSALYCGANVDFVDIDLHSGNMSIDALKEKLKISKQNNCLPKVVIPVHIAGQSCQMQEIHHLAQEYGFSIIEDASHAVGGQYQNSPVGSCTFSDITIFSFHPVKIITTAEGGMALTNDTKLAKKMKCLRSHGIVSDQEQMHEPSHGPWYYQQIDLGFNYRMTELQAALGLSQLNRINTFITRRNQLAKNYDQAFIDDKLTVLKASENTLSAYHLYLILLPETKGEEKEEKHKQAIIQLRKNNIFAHVHYIPVHLQPFYNKLGFRKGDFPNAETYYSRVISLPLYPELTTKEQKHIIEQVKALR
ncbi:MAG: UDP-4-amino-4,6-dideoxy-N-acetyl-beta-L-altrosamine transaminase [Alteromonadaceae bacterium]|nr:UDP-4-amino-4,6-dideoxy-N-acetyl-beta-L-altrosamine transaminase [Alteromonadaceae bacterium]